MIRAAILVALLLGAAACDDASGPTDSSSSRLLLPGVGGNPGLPLNVIDPAGIVTSVTLPPIDPAGRPGINFVPGKPTALRIDWVGGACDKAVELQVLPEQGISVVLTTNVRPGGCVAVGILRAIEIGFVRPVADQSIHLELR